MLLYKSKNKDANCLCEFIQNFRKGVSRPSNINVIDDIWVKLVLDNYKPRYLMSLMYWLIIGLHIFHLMPLR